VLINSDITLLQSPEPDALANVNTPEELDRIKRILHHKIAANQCILICYDIVARWHCPVLVKHAQAVIAASQSTDSWCRRLGLPGAQYLASSGVGTLGIADFDTVSISNLHRQILYNPSDVGQLKAEDCLRAITKAKPRY
jgi:hypothetical protein